MRLGNWIALAAFGFLATSSMAQVIVDNAGSARNGKVGYWSSMVAKGGDAAISYYCEDDMNNSPPEAYTLRFAWATGTSWQWTTVDYTAGSDTSMARGSDGLYQIAYESWNGLGYAVGTANTWNVSLVPIPDSVAPAHISMVLDSANHPHIAYFNLTNGGDNSLRYTWFDGSQWRTSANGGIIGTGLWTPTIGFSNTFLALDSAGAAHLAIAQPSDAVYAWGPIKYGTLAGNTWQFEDLGVTGVDPTLAIGSDGVPRMMFNGNGGLTYAYKSVGAWHFETILTSSADSLSMALTSANQPVASFGYSANEDMYIASRATGSWTVTRIDGDQTSDPHVILGRYGSSIAVDANDTPHVSYLDIDIYTTYTHRCDLKYFGPGGGGGPVCVAFLQPPISTQVCASGTSGFGVQVAGTGPFTYQWEWRTDAAQPWTNLLDGVNYDPANGSPLFAAAGAQAATVSLTDVGMTAGMSPLFRCTAAADCGSATSAAAALTLASPVTITADPQNTQTCDSGSASFTIGTSAPAGLRWQVLDSWSGSWMNLTDGTNPWSGYVCTVSGATGATLSLGAAPQTPGGMPQLFPMTVRCVVSSPCGDSESNPASLSISGPCCGSADFNGDGDVGTDSDIESFFECLAGNCCATCGSVDFNHDGDLGTDSDIEAFFRVLGGGNC